MNGASTVVFFEYFLPMGEVLPPGPPRRTGECTSLIRDPNPFNSRTDAAILLSLRDRLHVRLHRHCRILSSPVLPHAGEEEAATRHCGRHLWIVELQHALAVLHQRSCTRR